METQNEKRAAMKCYSTNGEDFSHYSVDEAVEALLENIGPDKRPTKGETAQLWEGEALQRKASEYLPDIAEALQDQAYGQVGEYAEGWDFSKKDSESLQLVVEKVVDQWATENKMQPHFSEVLNIEEFRVRFTDDEGGFVVVGENEPNDPPAHE